jgi:hypothetical protein
MMLKSVIVYSTAVFLILYGLRSLIAGIKKEKKSYWINLGYDSGLRKLLKDDYDRVNNIFWGTLSLFSGLTMAIFYSF